MTGFVCVMYSHTRQDTTDKQISLTNNLMSNGKSHETPQDQT